MRYGALICADSARLFDGLQGVTDWTGTTQFQDTELIRARELLGV